METQTIFMKTCNIYWISKQKKKIHGELFLNTPKKEKKRMKEENILQLPMLKIQAKKLHGEPFLNNPKKEKR